MAATLTEAGGGVVATPVPFDAALFADLEATDHEIGDNVETVAVGPIFGRYLTLQAPDLVVAAEAAIGLLRRVQDVVMDARNDALEAERRTCLYCGTPRSVEPGEDHCGRADCERQFGAEMYADLVMGGI